MAFLETIRPESHRLDIEELRAGRPGRACRRAGALRGRVCGARPAPATSSRPPAGCSARSAPYASWTSSATHAILPLLATDAGALLQVQTGVASHRRRFGGWHGGFWLPECAHAPWLDELLEDAGVRATCVELTGLFGLGDPRHLRPLAATDEARAVAA